MWNALARAFDPPRCLPHIGGRDYAEIITIDPARRSGKPCIRNTRITVYDVLDYLASA